MKKLKVILLILTVLLVVPFGVFAEESDNATEESKEVKVYLFHGEGCGFCEKAKTWFASIEEEHGHKFELVKYEVWNDEYNSKLMQAVADVRKESPGGVPYIIIGNQSWDGFTEDYQESMLSKINSEYEQDVKERYDVLDFVDLENLIPVEKDNTVRDIIVLVVVIAVVGTIIAGVMIARKETN